MINLHYVHDIIYGDKQKTVCEIVGKVNIYSTCQMIPIQNVEMRQRDNSLLRMNICDDTCGLTMMILI
jgi:hypothetical protein